MFFVPAVSVRKGGTSLINTLSNLGLLTNLKLCLDAGDLNSYDGSSQTWKDLSGGGYDFYRGSTSSAQTSDPTFNGTAGKQSNGEYFSYDGGDIFTAVSVPSFAQTLHKDSAAFSILEWVYPNAISATTQLFGAIATGSTSSPGIYFGNADTSSGQALMFAGSGASGATTLVKRSTILFNNSAWNLIGMSFDEAAGALTFCINGVFESFTGQVYSSPSAGSTDGFWIGRDGTGSLIDKSGNRCANLSVFSAALSQADMTAFYNATKGKFGL